MPWLAVGKIPAARAGLGSQYGAGGRIRRSCRRGDARDVRQGRWPDPSPRRHAEPGRGVRRTGPAALVPVRRADPPRSPVERPEARRRQGDRLDLQRWRGVTGAAGSRDPCRTALDGPGTAARSLRSRRVPRHRQCAFQDRPARRQSASRRPDRRHGGMGLRLCRSAVRHRQRRRPPAGNGYAGADRVAVAGRRRGPQSRRSESALPHRQGEARDLRGDARTGCTASAVPLRAGRTCFSPAIGPTTGLPATIEGALRSGETAAALAR